jgi:very-short-patch-repair endonuclease
MAGRCSSRGEAAIAELADRQHGVVARRQLLELGFRPGAIDRRVEAKRLHVVYRGVYAVGRRGIARHGVWMAAVLACGPRAWLSHRAAGALLGIRQAAGQIVDVTVERKLRGQRGIRAHRAALPEDERTIHAGIPVTTVTRTLLDLATQLQPHELKRAAEQAEALQLASPLSLTAVVQRHRGHRGAGALKTALGPLRPGLTRSELERRFLALVDQLALPPPRVNEWIEVGGELIQADCLWPHARLIAELDSRAWHDSTEAFDRDRRRDRRCIAEGWAVIRVTYRAVTAERRELEDQLRALLTAAPAPPS